MTPKRVNNYKDKLFLTNGMDKLVKMNPPEKRRKKVCKCVIRGVFLMAVIKNGQQELVHPYDYERYLCKFNFCPICGKTIKEVK
jgi:hypothetical protein